MKLRVFVDDITALVKGRNKEVTEMAKKEMKKLKEEVEEKGFKLSVEGKSKMIASCGFLENELNQFSEEGVTLADSVETLGVDLRTKVKSEEEEMQGEVFTRKEKEGIPKELHEGGRQEVAACRHDASKDVVSACSRDGSHGKVKIEETDGSCCGRGEHDLFVFVHGSIRPSSGGGAFHHGHSVLGRRSLDWKMAA